MKIDVNKISTEGRNINTLDIDRVSTTDMLYKINDEDAKVSLAVREAIPSISILVDKVVECINKGGRLIYMGAGTSGRIGLLDAVECPPTYGVSQDLVMGLLAGGMNAFVKAVEGAEDKEELGVNDLKSINLNSNDFVIGIAASGRTPYVLGGMKYAKSINVLTGCITTSLNSALEKTVDYPVVAYTGCEAITGSTRMKSGTAQKLICNMISTSVMINLGKVYENLMIDVMPTNEKLVARCINIIKTVTAYDDEMATSLFTKYKSVKKVIFSYITNITDDLVITNILKEHSGNIRKAINSVLGNSND